MRILLIEDDIDLGAALLRAIRESSYEAVWVRRLHEARGQMDAETFGCVLLDINLPDGEGFSLLEWLREQKHRVPVLVMTAREALDDRLRAFAAGADDYLIKPFAVAELHARVAAVTRRAAGFAENTWSLGEIEFDATRHRVTVGGRDTQLTPLELALFEQLIRTPEKVVTRRKIMSTVWSHDDEPSDSALDVLVYGLRKKLGGERLKTIRGVGYMLVAQ